MLSVPSCPTLPYAENAANTIRESKLHETTAISIVESKVKNKVAFLDLYQHDTALQRLI